MTLTLITLFILFIIVLIWNYSSKQKAIANTAAKTYCERHSVDLLDDTVAYLKTSCHRSPTTHFFYLQHQYEMRYFNPRTTESVRVILFIQHNKVSFLEEGGHTQNNVIYFKPPNKQGDI